MVSPFSPLARSSPLPTPLSSPSRSHFPFIAVAAASAYSCSTDATDAGIGGEPKEASVASLEVIDSKRSLLSRFSSLKLSYRPFPVIGWNRHVETIFASFFRSFPHVSLRRECLRTRDGGAVALDWVSGDESRLPPDSPVLILLPGLTGGSQDTYVRHMLVRARRKGWRVVVFNSRGCSHSPVTTPQESNGCPLAGAVSLCNPFNLPIADEDFRKGFNKIYDKALARSLRKIFKKHELLFEGLHDEYNIPMAANARTVREFDEGLTRVSFGFKSVDDYYFNSSSSNSIVHVRTPLLCIQAANDPIAPSRGIPREEIKENPHCLLLVTPKGGHLGWVAGEEAPFGAPWTDSVVMEFLEHLHNEKPVNSASSSCELDGVQPSLSSTSVKR